MKTPVMTAGEPFWTVWHGRDPLSLWGRVQPITRCNYWVICCVEGMVYRDQPGTWIILLHSVAQSISPSLKVWECVFYLYDLVGPAYYNKLQHRFPTVPHHLHPLRLPQIGGPCVTPTDYPTEICIAGCQTLHGQTKKVGKMNIFLTLTRGNSCLSYSGSKW